MANKFDKHFVKMKNTEKSSASATVHEPARQIQVGADLLNEASKAARQTEMDTIYVEPEYIHPSPNNEISMNEAEIEELANSLVEVGMINPIMVRFVSENNYRIVCGERRYRATLINIDKGLREKSKPIKCSLFNPELINLPLSDDEKEDYVRDVENAQQRNKTDGDKLMLMHKFEERYKILRERDPERFRGIKTRDLLSQDMNISVSTVSQFKKIENQGSDALQQAMVDGKVSISTAVDIASMDHKSQEDFISQILDSGKTEKITRKDLSQYQFEQRNNTKETPVKSESQQGKKTEQVIVETEPVDPNTTLITEKALKNEMKEVFQYLKSKNGLRIHKDDLFTIRNKIRDILLILKKYK